ncbi:HNH endonuclease signature motif containing protein [Priestia aryabhattai]|uniref:HNH endonuclease signature motif containing protein n=1 Tax=Priestia TaxID=2800373 RepID=UPI003F889720
MNDKKLDSNLDISTEEKKPLQNPRTSTIKRLFAISQNKCAFPNCSEDLVADGGKVTGKICHIKARREGGPRYDSEQSAEERHGFDNLILLCPKHHDVIDDDEKSYTVERLIEIKKEHESKSTKDIEVNSDTITSLIQNIYVENEIEINYEFANNGQIANTIINYVVLDTPNKQVRVSCNRVKISIEQIREELAQRKEGNGFVSSFIRSINHERYYTELFDYLDVKDSTTFIIFFEKVNELNECIKDVIRYAEETGLINEPGPIGHAGISNRIRGYFSYVEAAYDVDVTSLLKRLETLGK